MPLSSSRRYWPLLLLLLVALLLLSAGLYNGFPLVTSDSGTYLNSAIHYDVPDDRPIVYSLFVRATSFGASLWLVILAQALLLAWVLLRYVTDFAPRVSQGPGRLVVLVIAAWATGVSWYCSQLMPDIFTSIGLLTLGLLLFGRFRSGLEMAMLVLLTALSAMVHNSNLLTFSAVTLGFGIIAGWQQLFRKRLANFRHWLITTATVMACWLVLPAVHAAFGGGFVLSRAAPVFLLARLLEAGIVDKYLDLNCNSANPPRLCAVRDKLPNDAITFIWDENSPYRQTGGLEANLEEYRSIVRQIFASPRYYPYLAAEGMQATLRQLVHVAHGDGLFPFRENTNPYWKVQELVPHELKKYMSSMQNRNALDFRALNERTYLAQLLALLVVAGLAAAHLRAPDGRYARHVLLLVLVGLGLVANAFVTGALANVLDRLQGRVAWVLPFVALLIVAEFGVRWLKQLIYYFLPQTPPSAT